jgi:hypothetical protein
MNKIIPLVGLLLALVGCSTTIPDSINRSLNYKMEGKTVFVQDFEFDPSTATNVDRNFVKNFGKELSSYLVDSLRENGIKIADSQDRADALVKGLIIQVEGGSMHARVWVGFGYGASMVSVRGEVIDLRKSDSLLNFRLTKKSNFTWSNSEAAVRENLYEVAQELSRLIVNK